MPLSVTEARTRISSEWEVQSSDTFASSARVAGQQPAGENVEWSKVYDWTDGSGNTQFQELHRKTYTVSASPGTQDIDLRGGVENMIGDTLTFSNVRELLLYNLSKTPGDKILVGAAASNPWSELFDGNTSAQLPLNPEATLDLSDPRDGIPVTAGSQVLRLQNTTGNEINVEVIAKGIATTS